MDKLLLALIEAIKSGGPLAAHVATWYLVIDLLETMFDGATFIIIVWLIVSTVRWGMTKHYDAK